MRKYRRHRLTICHAGRLRRRVRPPDDSFSCISDERRRFRRNGLSLGRSREKGRLIRRKSQQTERGRERERERERERKDCKDFCAINDYLVGKIRRFWILERGRKRRWKMDSKGKSTFKRRSWIVDYFVRLNVFLFSQKRRETEIRRFERKFFNSLNDLHLKKEKHFKCKFCNFQFQRNGIIFLSNSKNKCIYLSNTDLFSLSIIVFRTILLHLFVETVNASPARLNSYFECFQLTNI